jgi:hypothetical protein
MTIPAHWMLADSGATMHMLLDLYWHSLMLRLTGLFAVLTVVNPTAFVLLSLFFVLWLRVVAVKRFASM